MKALTPDDWSIYSDKILWLKVKEERPDDAEINELAARMVEANKAKMAAAGNQSQGNPRVRPPGFGNNLLDYFGPPKESSTTPPQPPPEAQEDKPPIDMHSRQGKFEWVNLGEEYLPCILRGDEQYCSVRMVETNFIGKYVRYLSPELYSYSVIRSYFITEVEAKLLTEICIKHCEGRFGREPYTNQDLVVKFTDAKEFYDFLVHCYNRLVNPSTKEPTRCGFIRINGESVVPYTTKNEKQYVPLFYFEGETDNLKQKSAKLDIWDLAYLKFCCKVQGIRSELFECESCCVISLDAIKAYFPNETVFEEYWPPKVVDSALLLHDKDPGIGVNNASLKWIKAPPGMPSPPIAPSNPQPSQGSPVLSLAKDGTTVVTNGWPTNTQAQQPTQPQAVHPRYTHAMPPSVTSHSRQLAQQVPVSLHNGYTMSAQHQANAIQRNSFIPRSQNNMLHNMPTYYPNIHQTQAHQAMSLSNAATQLLQAQSNARNMSRMSPNHMGFYRRSPSTPTDIIDLSSPPLSPQRSLLQNGKQPSHPQMPAAPQHQPHLQPKSTEGDHGWKQLIPILQSLPRQQGSDPPFKMQKALVSGKMVPCINSKPYVYSELLMTVSDLLETFFPQVPLSKCREVLQNVLKVGLYSGNLQQKTILKENMKCQCLNDVVPLIQLKDVMTYMPQMKYILERCGTSEGSSAKRQRVS